MSVDDEITQDRYQDDPREHPPAPVEYEGFDMIAHCDPLVDAIFAERFPPGGDLDG